MWARFVRWYNEIHRHSALRFVTPGQRHRGEDIAILDQRHALYDAAKVQHPERWSGSTRNWEPEDTVYLNTGKPMKKEVDLTLKAAQKMQHLLPCTGGLLHPCNHQDYKKTLREDA